MDAAADQKPASAATRKELTQLMYQSDDSQAAIAAMKAILWDPDRCSSPQSALAAMSCLIGFRGTLTASCLETLDFPAIARLRDFLEHRYAPRRERVLFLALTVRFGR